VRTVTYTEQRKLQNIAEENKKPQKYKYIINTVKYVHLLDEVRLTMTRLSTTTCVILRSASIEIISPPSSGDW